MTRVRILSVFAVLSLGAVLAPSVDAMTVTPWDSSKALADIDRHRHRPSDRLLAQSAMLLLGDYQAIGEIVPSVTKGHRTVSLFTSGLNGTPPPMATIVGSSITVDLSSLFIGFSREHGDVQRIVNIGGLATGTYDSDTRRFTLTWEHLFDGHIQARPHTFVLKGVLMSGAEPVAVPAALVLYATGLAGLGSWTWWARRRQSASAG